MKTDEEGRAEEVEAKKQEQIAKAKQGKGEWHEDLASDSESIVRHIIRGSSGSFGGYANAELQVKADKGETEINADTIKDLQKESARLAEKEKKQS